MRAKISMVKLGASAQTASAPAKPASAMTMSRSRRQCAVTAARTGEPSA
jgi:hypothetical protein